jgi:hypothetical protein
MSRRGWWLACLVLVAAVLLGCLHQHARNTEPKIEVGMTLEQVKQVLGPRAEALWEMEVGRGVS